MIGFGLLRVLQEEADMRSIERLQPNVNLELVRGHRTRVQIGFIGGGLDSRSGVNRGPIELTRRPTSANAVTFENPINSATSPAASQFQTMITVEEPKPIQKK